MIGLDRKNILTETGVTSMIRVPDDSAIDEIIATCNGDLRGALKALLLVNEQLESELQHLYAQAAHGAAIRPANNSLH